MTDTNPMRKRNPVRTAARFLVKGVLPIAILAGSAVAAVNLMETAPKATRQAPERLARLVDVTTVQSGTDAVVVEAMGTVRAARKINLQPRVGGQVSWISPEFVPGGFIAKGQPILRIDPTDFELVVKQKEAALAEAKANLKIEAGQQTIARREYELLAKKVTTEERDLVLRQPQLATVEAAVDTAEAALRQAKLGLGPRDGDDPVRRHYRRPFGRRRPAGHDIDHADHPGRHRNLLDRGTGAGRQAAMDRHSAR